MQITQVDPRSLLPNPWNTNLVGPDNMEKLISSLERHGWIRPVLARRTEDGELQILGGQHRVEAAVSLSHETVPVIDLGDIDERRAKEIGLIDNARYGQDDAGALAALLDELGGIDVAVYLPFAPEELAALGHDVKVDFESLEIGEAPEEPEKPLKKTAKTHQMTRFKVPVDDLEDVTEIIQQIQKDQGFLESDSHANAGDALVWLARFYREHVDA